MIWRDLTSRILGNTNKLRNDWTGHGGVVGQEEARIRNERLLTEVQSLRNVMADAWREVKLIRALHSRRRGDMYENEVAVLMGSNSEFIKENRSMNICMDVERLYISKNGVDRALILLPLVKVDASPQSAKNACYFFNRVEREGARFVSYHFKDMPEIKDSFNDATETIRLLSE